MNLDRLKALIRLANNNPNEHEANLAARKVCQIIATEQFQLTEKQVKTAAGKVNEAKTWNDVVRSKEPQWRSNPPSGPGFDTAEFFKNWRRPEWNGFVDWNKAPHQNAPEPEWMPPEYKTKRAYDTYDPITGKKKTRPQAIRKCVKCGFEVMTFRIDEVPYICNPCHWKEKT